jgi:hypothetical protein
MFGFLVKKASTADSGPQHHQHRLSGKEDCGLCRYEFERHQRVQAERMTATTTTTPEQPGPPPLPSEEQAPLPEDPEKASIEGRVPAPGSIRPQTATTASGGIAEKPPLDRSRSYEYEALAQKHPKATDHLSITIGPPIIILLDLVVPCIIYYAWYNDQISRWRDSCREFRDRNGDCDVPRPEQFNKDILGYAIVSFGLGELYILITRVARLFFHRDECAPLLSRSKWELDATSWVYGVAMLVALIPFVVGSTMVIPELYLYGPSFLMAFLGALMLITFIPFPIPIGINSHARGSPLRPFIYYAAEDFIAVDGLQDREFRVRYNTRWSHSKGFRNMFR